MTLEEKFWDATACIRWRTLSFGLAAPSKERMQWARTKTPKSLDSVEAMAGKCKNVQRRVNEWLIRVASGEPAGVLVIMSRCMKCMNRLILFCSAMRSGRLLDDFRARTSIM